MDIEERQQLPSLSSGFASQKPLRDLFFLKQQPTRALVDLLHGGGVVVTACYSYGYIRSENSNNSHRRIEEVPKKLTLN